ncbi:thioredoxin [Archaeoglobus profundus]|uniref:Thioredoxin n=1 Tax=Archaeoglobus profundus (strain DSM 5631 / JCM 9629 / NBRC 100127 / Av18) TaxID=572546 RepID=D2RFL9_ARCPA|nr:thioredoxin [Archaeoglobus profundus]ADB57094.1 thioredoxin [Archaeoglobus profundus DSM 5631]
MDDIEEIRRKKLEKLAKKIRGDRMVGKPVKLDSTNFKKFIEENENVVVDFWAEWCGPCKLISPIIDELAKEYAGKVAFGKLNIDEDRTIAMQYGISAIPTLIFFKKGKAVSMIVGAYPKSELKRWIEKYL